MVSGFRNDIFTCCRNPRQSPSSLQSGSGTAWKKKLLRSAVGMEHSNITKQATQVSGAQELKDQKLQVPSQGLPLPWVSVQDLRQQTSQPPCHHLKEALISHLDRSEPRGKTTPRGKQTHTAFPTLSGKLLPYVSSWLSKQNTGLLMDSNENFHRPAIMSPFWQGPKVVVTG